MPWTLEKGSNVKSHAHTIELAWSHHWKTLHPTLDDGAPDIEKASHLNGTAEADLAITLAECSHHRANLNMRESIIFLRENKHDATYEKCMSPIESSAPSQKTGKYTVHPLDKFLMSQFPPFSRPGHATGIRLGQQSSNYTSTAFC